MDTMMSAPAALNASMPRMMPCTGACCPISEKVAAKAPLSLKIRSTFVTTFVYSVRQHGGWGDYNSERLTFSRRELPVTTKALLAPKTASNIGRAVCTQPGP